MAESNGDFGQDTSGQRALRVLDIMEKMSVQERQGENYRELVRLVRDAAHALGVEAQKQGGSVKRCLLWRRLFRLGIFSAPPLSGVSYNAWREVMAAEGRPGGAPVPDIISSCACPSPAFGRARALVPCTVSATQNAEPDLLAAGVGEAGDSDSRAAPLISLLMPVYNPCVEHLSAAVESVFAQSWPYWELCVADDASTNTDVIDMLMQYAERDARVKVFLRQENGHISIASNTALSMATGEWCALLDHDDILEPHALAVMAEAARKNPDAGVLFSDEDQVEEDQGKEEEAEAKCDLRCVNPQFKTAFDPDLLLACNVVGHLGLYRTDLLRRIGGFQVGREGAQDHDVALRCLAEMGERAFVHVPGVLYHWRRHAGSSSVNWQVKPYVREASLKSRQNFTQACALDAQFLFNECSIHAHIIFNPPRPFPLVSLCILADTGFSPAAVDLLLERTAWSKKEVLLVVRSEEAKGRKLDRLLGRSRICRNIQVVHAEDGDDSWGMAHAAAQAAQGSVLAFVRAGDIPLVADWMQRAMGVLCRPGVAVAACRSLTDGGFLIHAGYAVGHRQALNGEKNDEEIFLCPAYGGLHVSSGGYFGWAHLLHSVAAAPLSGFFCERALYETLGGFVAAARNSMGELADADFCLRARAQTGGRSVIVPGADMLSSRAVSCQAVDGLFADCWGNLLSHRPPFQNPMLTWTPGGWQFR